MDVMLVTLIDIVLLLFVPSKLLTLTIYILKVTLKLL